LTAILVTGGTGFIGRHLLGELVKRKDAEIYALVRPQSAAKLSRWGKRVTAVEGDLTRKGLGISAADRRRLAGA